MAAEYRQLSASWSSRVATGIPVLIDGALGTELERRGVPSHLPLWSTEALRDAPHVVASIHREYASAGAEVLTAATFRTQRRTLARAGGPRLEAEAAALTRLAVGLARRAAEAAPGTRWVAGSVAPLEDCYRPDLAPEDEVAAEEHREHIAHLLEAGVDVLAIETMNCTREARIAARAAAAAGVPFWVSFACGTDGRLLSGEPLDRAIDCVRDAGPSAVGINCLPPSAVARCLPILRSCGLATLVYANLGTPGETGSPSEDQSPAEFADEARRWLHAGARLVGGCCGTRPDHIRAVAEVLAASERA